MRQLVAKAALGAAARPVLGYRVAVETGAAVLAAERARGAELDRLEPYMKHMDSASEFEDYRRADVRFHIGIAEATHSARLVAAMTEVQGHMSDLIARIAHPDEVLRSSNAQHRQLVSALRRGDGTRAVGIVRQHIEGTEHILAGLLPEPPR
jgi:GntR family transcriptional repressor for pyruvate dehydrogenase complex